MTAISSNSSADKAAYTSLPFQKWGSYVQGVRACPFFHGALVSTTFSALDWIKNARALHLTLFSEVAEMRNMNTEVFSEISVFYVKMMSKFPWGRRAIVKFDIIDLKNGGIIR